MPQLFDYPTGAKADFYSPSVLVEYVTVNGATRTDFTTTPRSGGGATVTLASPAARGDAVCVVYVETPVQTLKDAKPAAVVVSEAGTLVRGRVEGVRLVFMPGASLVLADGATLSDCTFDFSNLITVADYPSAFVTIAGSDVTLTGNTARAPYPFVIGTTGVGKMVEFGADVSRVKITRNTFQYGYYAIYSLGKTLTDITIAENDLLGLRYDVWLDNLMGSGIRVDNNRFGAHPWTSPQTNLGEIFIVGGGQYYVPGWLTNSAYLTRYVSGVSVVGNEMLKTAHRAIYVVNAVGINVSSNVINSGALPGDNAGPDQSDDVLCLELCRTGMCTGNSIHASGENGIDILGCKHLTVTANVVRQCDAVALMFDISDGVRAGYSSGFDAVNHLNEYIDASGNYLEGANSAQEVRCGRSIRLANKIGKFWSGRAASSRYDLSVTINPTYVSKALCTWVDDIDASGCTKVRRESVLCGTDFASNTIRTPFEHGFQTGDRVNLFAGNSATGALPTSLDDITDYYVVRLTGTTLMLSTTFANAVAATPVTITFGATATGEVYLTDVQAGRVFIDTNPGFDIRGLKVSRDLAEVGALVSVAANTNYITTFSGLKGPRDSGSFRFAWLIRNAVTDFGAGSNLSVPRYFEFAPGATYDAAVTAGMRGINLQWHDRTQVKWRTGDAILPSGSVDPAGNPGTAYNDRTSGYVRSIAM